MPDFVDPLSNKYKFLRDAYSGEGGFASGNYLVPHPRETDDKYNRRKTLACYPNYVRKVVDSYLSYLFRRGPERTFEYDLYQAFCQDVDRLGTYIDDFMRRAFKLAMLLGAVYIIVDKPREKARTRAEELSRRLYPYLALRTPEALVAYETDEAGRITRVVFQERTMAASLSPAAEPELRYRIFTQTNWMLAKDPDGKSIIEQGEHGLGEVPVVPLFSTDPLMPGELRPTPWIWDLARVNYDLFNALSELRELFRSQTFSILALPVRTPQEAEGLSDLTISTENALPYNPEAGGTPSFIAPPEGPVRLYLEYVRELVGQIYRLANLEFTGGSQETGTARSGVALAFQFQEANRTLAQMALFCEQAEYRIARLVCQWMGREFKGSITYPRDFSVMDLQQELKNALDALSIQISETFDREVKKLVARKVLGDAVDDEVLEKIDTEIEAGSDPYAARVEEELEGASGE